MKRTSTSLIALGLVSMLAVACAQEASGELVVTGGDGPSAPQVSDDPAAVAQRAVDDVTDFWHETYPEVYGDEFQDLAGFYPYGPGTEMPPCGPFDLAYEEIADNAFYCPDDDIIAWDEGSLMPQLNEDFGAFTVAIVIAHEYGHAAQARFGTPDRTVDLELQADCFAGAWTQRVADGGAEGFDAERRRPRQDGGGHDLDPRPSEHRSERPHGARKRVRPGGRLPGRLRERRGEVRRVRQPR